MSLRGVVKGGLTKLSGGLVRNWVFDIIKQEDGNGSVRARNGGYDVVVLTADLLWKGRVRKRRLSTLKRLINDSGNVH